MAAPAANTNASNFEYVTYAPKGETCPACLRPIQSLEQVRRSVMERQSGAPVVVYRHIECGP